MVSPAPTTPAPMRQSIPREQLMGALDRLQAAGTWSPEQATALLDELDRGAGPPEGPPRPAGVPLSSRLAEAAAYAGAALVGAAGAVLVGQRWEELGRPGRVAVLAGITLVLAVVGLAVAAVRPRGRQIMLGPEHAVRRRLASTSLTIAAGTAAGTAGVLVTGHGLLAAAVTAVVAVAAAHWVAPSAVSETAGLGAVCLLAIAVLDEATPDQESTTATAMVLAFAAVGLGWAALSRTRVLTVPTLGLSLGLVVALYAGTIGVFAELQPGAAIAVGVLAVLAVGGLAYYVRTAEWPAAVAGVLALAILVLKFSSDSLSPVVAVFLTGLVLLGVGALLLVRRRAAGRR
ncbi:hypothetical protein GCM10010531_20210 [Blastococcus jejuensis]|uniref:DUF2157 domain-containing protein n=2 Tax=Blastococcus jejuensis TaxID=351224 RepID=A0ABP6P4P7_9ACTN